MDGGEGGAGGDRVGYAGGDRELEQTECLCFGNEFGVTTCISHWSIFRLSVVLEATCGMNKSQQMFDSNRATKQKGDRGRVSPEFEL